MLLHVLICYFCDTCHVLPVIVECQEVPIQEELGMVVVQSGELDLDRHQKSLDAASVSVATVHSDERKWQCFSSFVVLLFIETELLTDWFHWLFLLVAVVGVLSECVTWAAHFALIANGSSDA